MASVEGTNFLAWIASNDVGAPVCLGGKDGGYALTCYYNEKDQIIGVVVSVEGDVVDSIGWIPAERFMEELEYVQA